MIFSTSSSSFGLRSLKSTRSAGSHYKRAVFGSLIALSLASPLVWSAPASAAPVTIGVDDEPCEPFFAGGPYWKLSGFTEPENDPGDDPFPGYSSTYEVVGTSLFITTTVDSVAFDQGDVEMRIEFFADANCASGNGNPDADAPTGVNVCMAATNGSVESFELDFRTGVFNETYPIQEATVGGVYNLRDPSAGSVQWVPKYFDIESFDLDPSFTGDEIVLQLEFAASPVCELDGDSGERPAPFLDIDPETFLNRATAETGDLPDTL